MISLLELSVAFLALTLLIVAVLAMVLRRRLAAGRRDAQNGSVAGRAQPPAAGKEK